MAAKTAGDDFCVRGKKSQLRQPPKPLTSTDLTLDSPVAAVTTRRARRRDPASETYFRRHVEASFEAPAADEADRQGDRARLDGSNRPQSNNFKSYAAESLPGESDRWYLAPRYLYADEFPVNRLDGLPERPEATPDDRRAGLMGSLLAASDISRAAAVTGSDKPISPDSARKPPPPPPVDYDPLAAVHFPITLGRSYRLRDQIRDTATPAAPYPLTYSPPGSGLPYPPDPWRLRTPHNEAEFVPGFRSVGDHLAEAVPLAREATDLQNGGGGGGGGSREAQQRQRRRLMAEEAPSTAAAEVFVSSPYSVELAQLRLQRLRIEEEILLEVKRQQELERTSPPKDKWYELRTPQFHYEAHKNNGMVRGSTEDPLYDVRLLEYRQQLTDSSARFKETFDAYSRLHSLPAN